jgi:S1-C subfamily serine protease
MGLIVSAFKMCTQNLASASGLLTVLCLHGAAFAQATDEATQLGRSLRDVGETVSAQQRFNTAILAQSVRDLATDPLDKRRLHTHLSAMAPDVPFKARGPREISLYAKASPSVVFITNNDVLGSGTLISGDGRILTNWHVVRGTQGVWVYFKPTVEGGKPPRADAKRAVVTRFDEVADLALITVPNVPAGFRPLELGNMSEIQVGSDVHAIGHPTGESWTYTKGLVSQIRKRYEWATEARIKHSADVIQTQTPINPGNSGGPLISEDGRIVGVNSFKAKGEALNFAVSVDEVRRFLATTSNRLAPSSKPKPAAREATCEGRVLSKGRNKQNNEDRTEIDWNCDGRWDAILVVPDDVSKPIRLLVDSTDTGKIDIIVFDENRDGKWDYSLHDTNGDGKADLIGRHPDGQLKPSSFEPYLASR